MPASELVKTRFYKEWVKPQGIVSALAVNLEKGVTRTSLINIRTAVPINQQMRRRLGILVPHLQRAIAIGRLFDQNNATEKALTETLDHVEAAVFLVDANAGITFANDTAKKMLGQGHLSEEGRQRAARGRAGRKPYPAEHFRVSRKGGRLGWGAGRRSAADRYVRGAMVRSCSTPDVWKTTASWQQLRSRCRGVYP
jgi:PAS domain-containing protein